MFICGNDAEAKRAVAALLDQVGWEVEDVAGVEAARDRAAVHALVHPRLRARSVASRLHAAEVRRAFMQVAVLAADVFQDWEYFHLDSAGHRSKIRLRLIGADGASVPSPNCRPICRVLSSAIRRQRDTSRINCLVWRFTRNCRL